MAEKKSTKETDDPALDDLLDSALNDFNEKQKLDTEDKPKESTREPNTDKNSASNTLDDVWTTDFLTQAAEQFKEDLEKFIQNDTDNELSVSFQKMAQTVANAVKDENTLEDDGANTDFQSAIAQALDDLSATSENLQNEVDLSEIFGQASLEDAADGAILPFMQGLLQNLLSKELLYPALKQLVAEYPEWIEEKKATLPPADMKRCTKQLELMQQVCQQLETEEDGDTDETKTKRFKTILSLMQEVLACGQLPEELIGKQTPRFQTDGEGNSVIPTLLNTETPQNCCLM